MQTKLKFSCLVDFLVVYSECASIHMYIIYLCIVKRYTEKEEKLLIFATYDCSDAIFKRIHTHANSFDFLNNFNYNI